MYMFLIHNMQVCDTYIFMHDQFSDHTVWQDIFVGANFRTTSFWKYLYMFYFCTFTHVHIARSAIFNFSYVSFSYARLTYEKYKNY